MNKKLKMILICIVLLAICVAFTFGQPSMLRYGNRAGCYGFHNVAVGPSPHFASWHRISTDPVLILDNRYQFRFPAQHWLQLQILDPVTGEIVRDLEFPIRSNINTFALADGEDVIAIARGHWIDESGELLLFDLETDNPPKNLTAIERTGFVMWHPNEKVLATIYYPKGYDQGSNIVALYDVNDTNPVQTDTFRLKRVAINRFLGWSNNADVIAVSQLDSVGEIPYFIFLEKGQIEKSLYHESHHHCVTNGQWSPQEPILAFSGTNTETEGWDIFLEAVASPDRADRSLINLTNTSGEDELHPIWSPDGNRVAYVKVYLDAADNRRQELFVIDLNDATYTPIQLTDTLDGPADKPVWLSDDEIAYLSWSLTEHTWSLKNVSLVERESRKIMDIPQVWYKEP
ncbi:MAG: hypothetical protein R6X32_23870 [Chloroflexota bacterium]|jgi:WD40 repeat protein